MSGLPSELHQALVDLPRTGRLVKGRAYRQVWRWEYGDRPYYLKLYPSSGLRNWMRRRFRGSPAMLEFTRLQRMQKAGVPSPRAVAALIGYVATGMRGDAVLIEGLEPSIQLDRYLNQWELSGEVPPNHRQLAQQLIDILARLGGAGLGHEDLHLGNVLLKGDKLYLLDGYAVHTGGLLMRDLLRLALSVQPYATRGDYLRAWKKLGPGGPPPATARIWSEMWRELLARAFRNDRYFGHLRFGPWRGHFFRHSKFPRRWSPASRLDISEKDWLEAWPRLLQQMESGQFEVIKRSGSGDVLAGDIVVGGRPISVVIKRPRRKFWYRYLNEIGRGSRAWRAWKKTWQLIVRNIPTAWPLLMMQKRCCGYATDGLIVYERIPGRTLATIDVKAEGRERYRQLLHRCGRLLRQLEQSGLALHDSKTTNWMVREDEKLGLVPILIDVDGIRRFTWNGGLPRLLRSLREGSAPFTAEDALAVARGYAPFAGDVELARLAEIDQTQAAAVARDSTQGGEARA